jgi:anti-sigma-K factor RskA
MIVHDESLLDTIAVYALGALPQAEARSIAEHIGSCSACAREYAELRATADLVGFEAEILPDALDDLAARRLKSRVMISVRESVRDAAPVAIVSKKLSTNGAVARSRTSWLPYGTAVAAALVAAVSLTNNATLRNDRTSDAIRVASLETDARSARARADALQARVGELDARVASIIAPGSRHFVVASGEVVKSGNRIVIALHDLPKLPAGKVYQVWTLTNGAKTVAPSITFAPDAAGVALVELPDNAARLAAVAVSVEPVGGSKVPTSKPSFIRALS